MTKPKPIPTPLLSRPTGDDWRRLRECHGLTQSDLATLVYRSPDAAKKWKQDRGDGDLHVGIWRCCWDNSDEKRRVNGRRESAEIAPDRADAGSVAKPI